MCLACYSCCRPRLCTVLLVTALKIKDLKICGHFNPSLMWMGAQADKLVRVNSTRFFSTLWLCMSRVIIGLIGDPHDNLILQLYTVINGDMLIPFTPISC